MGRIIELDTKCLVPIQKEIFMDNIKDILRDYNEEPLKNIIPVREHPNYPGKHMLLDGHHSSCITDVLNESSSFVRLYGWVADSETDFIGELGSDFHYGDLYMKNRNIKFQYLRAEELASMPEVPNSIPELRAMYSYLESIETLRDFVYG